MLGAFGSWARAARRDDGQGLSLLRAPGNAGPARRPRAYAVCGPPFGLPKSVSRPSWAEVKGWDADPPQEAGKGAAPAGS